MQKNVKHGKSIQKKSFHFGYIFEDAKTPSVKQVENGCLFRSFVPPKIRGSQSISRPIRGGLEMRAPRSARVASNANMSPLQFSVHLRSATSASSPRLAADRLEGGPSGTGTAMTEAGDCICYRTDRGRGRSAASLSQPCSPLSRRI